MLSCDEVSLAHEKRDSHIAPGEEFIVIIEIVNINALPEKREEMRRALVLFPGPMAVEPGCLRCRLYQDASDADNFRLELHWESHSHLIRHLRSEAYKKILLLMELGAAPPGIQFYSVTELQGLNLIEAARE